ncbi:MAG: DUF4411 family protein [Gammaproteobacteria bacterium]|nr:DUF4411 family protein [Gammaproteobacteria bacterium]
MTYLLDSNVFIQAHRRYYAFDIVPGFWAFLQNYSTNNTIYSIETVKDELKKGGKEEDYLVKWMNHFQFQKLTEEVFSILSRSIIPFIGEDIRNNIRTNIPPNYEIEFEKFTQRDNADQFLIAYAQSYQCTIVTHEVSNPKDKNSKNQMSGKNYFKIPHLCSKLNKKYGWDLKCIDTFELLRQLKCQLILDETKAP